MISKLLSKLFGGGGERGAADTPAAATEYKGFSIHPTPKNTGSHWQVSGVIAREADGQRREESFIRADTCTSRDEAVDMTVRKAKQIIDERGAKFLAD